MKCRLNKLIFEPGGICQIKMSDEFCEFLATKLSLDPSVVKSYRGEFDAAAKSGGAVAGKCAHKFKTGKNKDTFCGAEPGKGTDRCKKHTTKDASPVEKKEEEKAPAAKPAAKTPAKTKAADKDKTGLEGKPTAEIVEKRRTELIITLNAWSNWENRNTGFCFDRATKAVIGKQLPNGTVGTLTPTDVELCKLNNWKYTVAGQTHVPVESLVKSTGSVQIEDDDDDDDDLDDLYE
jgi:hypothetical protein